MEATGPQLSPEEWGAKYTPFIPRYELCARKLCDLLEELVARASISTEAVEGRAKGLESFVNKVRDKGQQYQDPIAQMPDLVGLRIVTFFVADSSQVRSIIEENFEIDWSRSSVGGTDGDPDRFGYVSDHYQVRLLPTRAALPEWEKHRDVWVEIQVRTVLQHAWAAISHKLQYKAEREVPRELRRQLSRMSALLEVADKEFSELSDATVQLDAQYSAAIGGGDLDVELNADSLATFLNITKRHLVYASAAETLGYASYEGDPTIPAGPNDSNFDMLVSFVMEGADLTQETKVADLDLLLPDPMPESIRGGLAEILKLSIENGFLPTAVPLDMLVLAHCIALRGGLDPKETADRTFYVDELKDALQAALYNFEDPPPADGAA